MERLLEKQKELTERVRANEKVVAAIGLFGSVAVAFIGAGYFAPKAEACSPRLDGEPTYCPSWNDIDVLKKPVEDSIPTERDFPYDQSYRLTLYDSRYDVAHMGHDFPTNEWIQKIRDHESRKTRTNPEDSINKALEDMEFDYGSNDPTESKELLQLSGDRDQSSFRW